MSIYKEEKSGTWYVMVRYDNWKGERKQKCKRGFVTKRSTGLGTAFCYAVFIGYEHAFWRFRKAVR